MQVQPKRTHSATWATLSFLSVRLLQTNFESLFEKHEEQVEEQGLSNFAGT